MTGRLLRFLGIPAIDAVSLGVFRTLIGGSLFLIVLAYPIDAVPLEAQRVYSPLAGAAWVRALAASGAATAAVHVLALASALAFAAGIRPRVAYAVLVGTLSLRTLFILLQAGAHDWGTPLLTLWALVVVPWNDAPSPLAAVRRNDRTSGRESASGDVVSQRSWRYGFAVWLPGLTLGLAFAAAALEKLRRSGLDWITTGAVRYHFVEDAANAPFDLGLWVATQQPLAVALSLGGILIEASFIAVIFVRDWRLRAIFGLAAAGLMLGFWVFQGIHWWAWLMLLFAFLPWNRTCHDAPREGLQPMYGIVVAALLAGQVWASYHRIEVEPLLSNYPMYSTTYGSPEDYEQHHRRLVIRTNGVDITERVQAVDGAGPVSRAAESAAGAQPPDPEVRRALGEFRERYERAFGPAPASVEVFFFKRSFDWKAGRFNPEAFEPLGTVSLVSHP